MNDKWMNDLKDLSGDFRKKAPEGLLDDIKQEMSRRGVVPASETKKAPVVPIRWWRSAAAVAALALATGVAIYEWNREIMPPQPTIVETEFETEIDAESFDEKITPVQEEKIAEATPTAFVKKRSGHQNVPSGIIPLLAEESQSAERTSLAVDDKTKEAEAQIKDEYTDEVTKTTQDEPKNAVEETKTPDKVQNVTTHELEYLAMNTRPKHNSHSQRTGWGVGAYYGGGGNFSMDMTSGSGEYAMMDDPVGTSTQNYYDGEKANEVVELPEEKHHKPLRFGLSVRYVLDERWSLLSGITYSYLNSDIYVVYGSTIQSAEQKLYYMGVPLAASYSIWQNDHVNIYAVAGGEIEKLVKGKLIVDRGVNHKSYTESVKENRPVFSTSASAGIEYQTKNGVSLYAEPGASYHFDNGSGVRSAYTDKPWDFTINIGLRININK
ncbi:MAG: hypothetical protein IKO08_06935 [Bacteroidales bacterium]|nr:hypothetical protein [Bacteroidales bacterium]